MSEPATSTFLADDTLDVEQISVRRWSGVVPGTIRIQVIGSMASERELPKHLRSVNVRGFVLRPNQVDSLMRRLLSVGPTPSEMDADLRALADENDREVPPSG